MNTELAPPNPYTPPASDATQSSGTSNTSARLGPLLYFALGGILGAASAIPLIATIPISADPNPIGYLLILLGVPGGGLAYRFRSRNWPVDPTVRTRQRHGILLTLLLPASIAILTGMQAQGFMMTVVGGLISLSLAAGILLAGTRRKNDG